MSKPSKIDAAINSSPIQSSLSYEEAFRELEHIVSQMESGQMLLEDALNAYKKGNMLLEYCQKSLADVEQQIQLLNERQQLVPFTPAND